jgi:hypothetical protein
MGSLLLFLLLASCSAWPKTSQYTVAIKDINGTWLRVRPAGPSPQEIRQSPNVHTKEFGWGIGKTLPNGTYEFDLPNARMLIPVIGTAEILSVKKVGVSDIKLRILNIGTQRVLKEKNLTANALQRAIEQQSSVFMVHFADRDHIAIEQSNEIGAFGIIVGDELKLFRLSGPS